MTILRVATPEDHLADDAKHAECIRRTGYPATIVSPTFYDHLEAAGYDMSYFVPSRLLPTEKGQSPWQTVPEPDGRHHLRVKPRS